MEATAHSSIAPVPHIPRGVLDDLARVERRLGCELVSREPRITAIAEHLVGAGGKRVRPLILLLVAHAATEGPLARRDHVVEVAVALELIHSASLLHDDIIDDGQTRRGRPSALARFGLGATLVTGDFLFCRGLGICARVDACVMRWVADLCVALTEGEMLQARFRHDPRVAAADCIEIIDRKTASLFATSARIATHLAGADPALVAAMHACGMHLGRAFQLKDDLLDIEGATVCTGKPHGVDLRDGNPSLPIVLALDRDPEVRRIFVLQQPTAMDVEQGLAHIRRTGVLHEVAERARDELETARAALTVLPASPCRGTLDAVLRNLGARSS